MTSAPCSAYALRYRDDVVSLTTMEAPLPGTDYYEQRKVAKSPWHFNFHANPDIAVYLTPVRTLVHHPLLRRPHLPPDAISQLRLDVYARAFEAPGAMRALCEIYRELDHDADIPRADIASDGKLTSPSSPPAMAPRPSPPTTAPMCEEIANDVTGHLVPDAGHWIAEENPTTSPDVPRLRHLSQNETAKSAEPLTHPTSSDMP